MDFEYHRIGDVVEARASGTAKEIASLVLGLQGKPDPVIQVTSKLITKENRARLTDTIRDILANQIQGKNLEQQPDPTSPELKQDEESLRE